LYYVEVFVNEYLYKVTVDDAVPFQYVNQKNYKVTVDDAVPFQHVNKALELLPSCQENYL